MLEIVRNLVIDRVLYLLDTHLVRIKQEIDKKCES
jgi:hypothetical protein